MVVDHPLFALLWWHRDGCRRMGGTPGAGVLYLPSSQRRPRGPRLIAPVMLRLVGVHRWILTPAGPPVLGPTIPTATPYDLGFCLTDACVNRAMAAFMVQGQLNLSVTQVPFGMNTISLTMAIMSALLGDPTYNTASPSCSVTVVLKPSAAAVARAPLGRDGNGRPDGSQPPHRRHRRSGRRAARAHQRQRHLRSARNAQRLRPADRTGGRGHRPHRHPGDGRFRSVGIRPSSPPA